MPAASIYTKGYRDRNKARIIRGGEEYFTTLIRLISEARESIHLQCYIFDDDETGKRIIKALVEAVQRKVHVFLMADGYASQVMSQAFVNELRNAGVHFRFFEPIIKSSHFYFGRRLHHKVFVADAFYSLVGGVNISDHYNDLPGKRAWLDFAVYAEGEVSQELCVLCWKTWNNFSFQVKRGSCEVPTNLILPKADDGCRIRMRRNDWVRRKNEISLSYIHMLQHARSHVLICCSYFLPGKMIRGLLARAAKRGVKVRIIIAGPSDVIVAKNAERWMYDWMLRNNIEVFEYQPSVLHAKVAVCDSEWTTIGSYNINKLSAYASIELNLDIQHEGLAVEMESILTGIIKRDCVPITHETHLKRKNFLIQFVRWVSYQFIRIMFFITTFYYKQR